MVSTTGVAAAAAALAVTVLAVSGLVKDDLRWSMATGWVSSSRWSAAGGAFRTGIVSTSGAVNSTGVSTSGANSTGGVSTSVAVNSTGGVSTSGAANSTGEERGQRKRRQIAVAFPPGAVIGIIPKFGWLLYEGDNNEELDFRVETEFLYHFPHVKDTGGIQTGERRRQYDGSYNSLDSDGWYAVHRQRRMVRDKTAVYKGLVSVFRRLGLEGEACLLKTICEITHSPLLLDGLVGELLNIALIPSHTVDGTPDELDEYREAERLGTSGRDCRAAYSQCRISLFKQLDS